MSGRNLTAAPAEKPAIPKNFDLSRYPKFTESFTCLKHLKTKKKDILNPTNITPIFKANCSHPAVFRLFWCCLCSVFERQDTKLLQVLCSAHCSDLKLNKRLVVARWAMFNGYVGFFRATSGYKSFNGDHTGFINQNPSKTHIDMS
jgi:hypothetical protein